MLDSQEQDLFKNIVSNKLILTEFGFYDKTVFFIDGHQKREIKPTIFNWLNSILNPDFGKDLLSFSLKSKSSKGYVLSTAMGKFDIKKKYGKWDKVRFEMRCLSNQVLSDWVSFIEGHFKDASLKRTSPGTDKLIYDP